MFTAKPILPTLTKHKQIFYDPSGNRWKLSIFASSVITMLVVVILAVGIPSGIAIASIQDQGTKSKTQPILKPATNIKNTAFFTTNTEKSFISLKENSKNINNLVLPWLEIKKIDGKIKTNLLDHPYSKLVDEVIEKSNHDINKLLLLSDTDYIKPLYENRYNGNVLKELINKPELQNDFITSLNQAFKTGNYKGLIVEIQEDTIGKKYDQYQQFLNKLSINLLDKNLVMDTKVNIFDDPKIIEIDKKFSNTVILESYQELVFNKNPAAAVDPNSYQSKANLQPIQTDFEQLNKVLSAFPDIKYSIAIPTQSIDLYLYNDVPGWHGQLSFGEVGEIIKKYNPEIKYSSLSGLSSFQYKDDKNQEHKVLVNDATTTYNLLYNSKSLYKQPVSIDLENIGYEEPSTWQIIQSNDNTANKEVLKNKLQFETEIDVIGAGVINVLKKNPDYGTREIQFVGDKIIDVKVSKLPNKAIVSKTGYKNGYIALTFDDGPDPKYTPQILDILKENNIKASFFVLGSNVLDHPELAQRILNEGHLLENHTYTHARLKNAGSQELIDEVESTQNSIKEITNTVPKYFRTPYNDFGNYETNAELQPLRTLDFLNIKTAESDLDSHDYDTQEVSQILNFIKTGFDEKNSSQLLFHDSGGFTREGTVKVLPEVIKFLKEKNLKFVTVEELDKVSQSNVKSSFENVKAATFGFPKLFFMNLVNKSDLIFRLLLFVATTLGVVRFIVLLIGLFKYFSRKKVQFSKIEQLENQPGVSVLIPCYNEEKVVCNTIDSILNSDYTNLEVVIIDDCSTDGSLGLIQSEYGKNPRVTILTKANGGKAEALNFGIQQAKYDFLVSMDADTMFLHDTVSRMVVHFSDPKVGGVAGFVEIGNDYFYQKAHGESNSTKAKFNWLTTCQRLEYIFGQNFDKQAYDGLGCVIVVPGAIGAWRKQVILDVGDRKSVV